jgi:hypothetical protein
MEMTVRGKGGKPKAGFPTFPLPLETPQNPRAFHIPTAPTADPYIYGRETQKTWPETSTPGVGQIKLPKWANYSCQTHPTASNCWSVLKFGFMR